MTSTDLHEETTSAANVDPIPAQPIPQPRGRPDGVSVVSHGVLFVWSIIVIAPLLWTLLSSFKTSSEIFSSPFSLPADWNLDNFRTAWTQEGFGNYFLNTIVIVGSALVIVMTLGSMCAYVLARFRFPGNRLIYYLMLAGLTFPVFLAIVPLFLLMRDIGLLNRQPGLVVVYVAFALPFTVFFLYPFFKRLPNEISEAAAVDGAGEWRTFFQVMLPMAKPGVVSVAIFNFLGLWNQFLLPVSLNTDQDNYVLSQGLSRFASQAGYAVDFGALFASVMIVVVPVLIMYVIFQRQLRGSVAQGTIK
ncbi:MAG: sugar transporter permease [Desertimonas sp.]|nr:sugar transporter permease [Desertimonas sp.]